MKPWKIILIVLGAITLLVGVILGVVFYATSGVTKSADAFFEAAHEGDYAKAYALTSTELRNDTTAQGLQRFLEANGLDKVTDTSWGSRSIENGVGELSGSLTTEGGGKIPITLRLVKENDEWHISYLEKQKSGLSDNGGLSEFADIPPESQQQEMVQQDTRRFASALGDETFAAFLPQWISTMTEKELEDGFNASRANREDIMAVIAQPPTVTSAEITGEGALRLKGYFANEAGRYDFEYEYVTEGGKAKLLAFNFQLR